MFESPSGPHTRLYLTVREYLGPASGGSESAAINEGQKVLPKNFAKNTDKVKFGVPSVTPVTSHNNTSKYVLSFDPSIIFIFLLLKNVSSMWGLLMSFYD